MSSLANALYPQVLKLSDLLFNSYSLYAVPGDNPHLRGYPDNNLLNRHEKYEVLYFINAFLKYHKLNSIADGHKVERMIKTHLPSDIRSHVNVHNWITNHWNKYV